MGWSYSAYRLNGDATETLLATDLPLSEVNITQALSGVNSLSASVTPEVARLQGVDLSIFRPWSTAIYADLDGYLRGAGIVTSAPVGDDKCTISAVGFVGLLHGMPMSAELSYTDTDPLTIVRALVAHVQKQKAGNLGLTLSIDPATSPVRLGLKAASTWPRYTTGSKTNALIATKAGFAFTWPKTSTDAAKTMYGFGTREFKKNEDDDRIVVRNVTTGKLSEQTTGTSPHPGWQTFGLLTTDSEPTENADGEALEPYTITWYADHDLGAKFDDLADLGSFEYVEDHRWSGEKAAHTLRIGHPRIGRKRTDLRFAAGENVTEIPDVEVDGEDYASEVVVLGAGEGIEMVRGAWPVSKAGRLYRPKIYTDKTITTPAAAKKKATELAKKWAGEEDIKTLVVRDHPNAPIGSFTLGDTITYLGSDYGWAAGKDMAVRILEQTIEPDNGDIVTLTVTRADKVDFGDG